MLVQEAQMERLESGLLAVRRQLAHISSAGSQRARGRLREPTLKAVEEGVAKVLTDPDRSRSGSYGSILCIRTIYVVWCTGNHWVTTWPTFAWGRAGCVVSKNLNLEKFKMEVTCEEC